MALDINPDVNPFKRFDKAHPNKDLSNPYLDLKKHPRDGLYAIRVTGIIYAAFITHGWGWGGLWTRSRDYMHFSKNDE